MSDIGVRELKIHASDIIRKVKEKRMRYIVTHRGRPVAAIIPVEEAVPGSESSASAWAELETLGRQVSENWLTKRSSVEVLSEMRR